MRRESAGDDVSTFPVMTDAYVVHTNWEPEGKRPVRHVYGPYTKSRAQTEARKMRREAEETVHLRPGTFTASVHLLIDERKWDQ